MMYTYLKAFGLLALTIGANFSASLYGCQLQRELRQNTYAKHTLGILLLLFLVILADYNELVGNVRQNDIVTPIIVVKTLGIYMLFLLFIKMNLYFTIAVILLFVIFILLEMEMDNKTEKIQQQLENIQYYIFYGTILTIVIGTSYYAYSQYMEYGKKFSIWKFFSDTKCSGVN
jgi:CDP-diglyceride synthetase